MQISVKRIERINYISSIKNSTNGIITLSDITNDDINKIQLNNNKDYTQLEMLHMIQVFKSEYNLQNSDMDFLTHTMYKKEIQKLIDKGVHNYNITPPKKDGGMWCTYVHDDTKKNHRRQIQGRSEKGFYKSLYFWYYPNHDKYSDASISSLIEETLSYKQNTQKVSEETIKRIRLDYKKYYEHTSFSKKPIIKISAKDCEDFIQQYANANTKKKAFNNMLGVANAVFDYSIRRLEIITVNPMKKAVINRKILNSGITESDEARVYFPDERDKLFAIIEKHFAEPNYEKKADLYGILLCFILGLRIGELVALQWDDISLRFHTISINKMEKSHSYEIVNHTKNYENRIMDLSDYTIAIFEGLKEVTQNFNHDSEYLFRNEKGRRHCRGLDNTLRDLCDEAGIPQKSFHDIRRTVASEMHEQGRSLEEIRRWLGHKDKSTTDGYIYSLKRRSEYANIVHASLKNNEAKIIQAS